MTNHYWTAGAPHAHAVSRQGVDNLSHQPLLSDHQFNHYRTTYHTNHYRTAGAPHAHAVSRPGVVEGSYHTAGTVRDGLVGQSRATELEVG